MANLLMLRPSVFDESVSAKQRLLLQFIQAALLSLLLWFSFKVIMRDQVSSILPAPDSHWAVAGQTPSRSAFPVSPVSLKG